jgi:hypothetical protein
MTFQRTYGGTSNDYGYSVAQTTDGGYVITGRFGGDVWLIKTAASGDTMWTRTYGGTARDRGYSVAQTTDGGYVIAGWTYSFGAGESDVYLVKTDANGDTMWTRTYGGTDRDQGYSVRQTADGGYVIAGTTCSFAPYFYFDIYLVKTDSCGDTVWTRNWGYEDEDEGYAVAQTADGGYVVTGYSEVGLWLIRTNADGDTVWTRGYYDMGMDGGYSVAQTSDGGYIVAGGGYADGGTVCLLRTDASGDTVWTRAWGGVTYDVGRSVAMTADGGYVIAGSMDLFSIGGPDVWLIRTDSAGDTLWTRATTSGSSRPTRPGTAQRSRSRSRRSPTSLLELPSYAAYYFVRCGVQRHSIMPPDGR